MKPLQLHTNSLNEFKKILKIAFIGTLIGIAGFFLIAYTLGDTSAYSTGYEFGKLLAYSVEKIRTSIVRGLQLSGALLALIISLKRNKSMVWTLLHTAFGWGYILFVLYSERGSKDI